MAWISGVGNTRFGKLPDEDTVSLMTEAAQSALDDAGLTRGNIDGFLCGYSTTWPHLMAASTFAEHFGLRPSYCHSIQTGGSTAAAMTMLASCLVDAGQCRNVLIVAGENRATGAAPESRMKTLADSGHRDFEVPFGPTAPAYFALVASRYMLEYGHSAEELAGFPVLLRGYAAANPDAHFRTRITAADVRASRMIADPLRLLDCCPMSDGGAAIVVSARSRSAGVRIAGAAQSHPHQNLVGARSLVDFDSHKALDAALAQAGRSREEIDVCGIYDSFSATLLIFLEDLGLVPRGGAIDALRRGDFSATGRMPVNTHGGLLSFGHSGVAGGMMHIIEVFRQLSGRAGERSVGERKLGLVHAEGGTFSTQVSLLLEKEKRI